MTKLQKSKPLRGPLAKWIFSDDSPRFIAKLVFANQKLCILLLTHALTYLVRAILTEQCHLPVSATAGMGVGVAM